MSEKEKREFFRFERRCQALADKFYASRWHEIDRSQSCREFDCLLDGRWKIEEKFRTHAYNDVLIELIQDLKSNAPGWFYETSCDYLHYFFMGDDKIIKLFRFNWKNFSSWLIKDYLPEHTQGRYVISKKGWGITLNLSVPISDIPAKLYLSYGSEK